MIIFNLELLNMFLAFIGIVGWGWVWWFSKYKTGHDMRIQIGIISLGTVWVLLLFADTVQVTQPKSLAMTARALLLFGLWCCMPLLKNNTKK